MPGSGGGLAEGDRMAVKALTRMNADTTALCERPFPRSASSGRGHGRSHGIRRESAVPGFEIQVEVAVEDRLEAGIGQRLRLEHGGLHRAPAEFVVRARR